MNGETTGPVVFVAGLLGFAGSVAAVMAGALDELVAAAAPTAGLLVVLVAVAAALIRVAPRGTLVGRFAPHDHATGAHLRPGLKRRIDRHENEHLAKARQFGADGYWEYDRDGGASFYISRGRERLTPVQLAAVALAPRSDPNTADRKIAERHLRAYPRAERGDRRREARKLARS